MTINGHSRKNKDLFGAIFGQAYLSAEMWWALVLQHTMMLGANHIKYYLILPGLLEKDDGRRPAYIPSRALQHG